MVVVTTFTFIWLCFCSVGGMMPCLQGQRHIKLLATEVTRMRAEIQVLEGQLRTSRPTRLTFHTGAGG